ncbi:MAG: hypothetical protein KF764_29600 [Labilithrix sp.]|nr:hypothetical protein [Labilithrix sp.]
MKLSRDRMIVLALALGAVATATISCADTEADPYTPPPVDNGDAALPGVDAADTAPDASPEAGPRVCSDHGFCHTSVPADQVLAGVWGDGTGVAWAVTAKGDVLRWDGNAWKVHASKLGPLRAIWGSGPTDVWIGGDSGLYHGTGATSAALEFAESALPESATVASIWGASATDVWAVGWLEDEIGERQGRVFHLGAGAGAEWTLDPLSAEGAEYSHVAGSAGAGVWISGARPRPDEPWLNEILLFHKRGAGKFALETLPDDPVPYEPMGQIGSVRAMAVTADSRIWIYGDNVIEGPGIWRGTSADGGMTFTWTHAPDGDPLAPRITAVFGTLADDAWAVGELGRVRRWDGAEWNTAAITLTKLPVVDTFRAVWSRGAEEGWVVGDGIALRYDPAQRKDGGAK